MSEGKMWQHIDTFLLLRAKTFRDNKNLTTSAYFSFILYREETKLHCA
jgi:hypothetical protein